MPIFENFKRISNKIFVFSKEEKSDRAVVAKKFVLYYEYLKKVLFESNFIETIIES